MTTNTPNPFPPSLEDHEQTCIARREVCALASTAMRVSRERPGLIHDVDEEDHEDRIQLLRQTLARIGWTTDVALRKLGDGGVFASAEDWMLPGA